MLLPGCHLLLAMLSPVVFFEITDSGEPQNAIPLN